VRVSEKCLEADFCGFKVQVLGFSRSLPICSGSCYRTTPVFSYETCIAWSEGSVSGSERVPSVAASMHINLRVHFVPKFTRLAQLVISLRKRDI
jgi:hypothetical protein